MRSVLATVSLAGGGTQGTSGMTSVGLQTGVEVMVGEVGATGEAGEMEVTGDRAESTDRVVMVEFDRSTLRCDWASSSPPGYMSARMPLSGGGKIMVSFTCYSNSSTF